MEENSDKQRKHRRIDAIKKVRYQVLIAREGEGFSHNLSAGGGCFMLNEQLSPGSLVQLELQNPQEGGEPIKLYCKVIWQKGFLTGVRFLND